MRIKSISVDFEKTKTFKKEIGLHCIVIHLYFIRIWLLDSTLIEMIKQSHKNGAQEGRQILKN